MNWDKIIIMAITVASRGSPVSVGVLLIEDGVDGGRTLLLLSLMRFEEVTWAGYLHDSPDISTRPDTRQAESEIPSLPSLKCSAQEPTPPNMLFFIIARTQGRSGDGRQYPLVSISLLKRGPPCLEASNSGMSVWVSSCGVG